MVKGCVIVADLEGTSCHFVVGRLDVLWGIVAVSNGCTDLGWSVDCEPEIDQIPSVLVCIMLGSCKKLQQANPTEELSNTPEV